MRNGLKWQLHFRQPSQGSMLQVESLHLHWSIDGAAAAAAAAAKEGRRRGGSSRQRRQHWKLIVSIQGVKSAVIGASDVVYDDDNARVASVRLDAADLENVAIGGGRRHRKRTTTTTTTVQVKCRGRDCIFLRRWHLGAQLRLIEQEPDLTRRLLRNKRHSSSSGSKRNHKKVSSSASTSSTTTRRPQPQPKEIFQQQLNKKNKGGGGGGGGGVGGGDKSAPSSCSSSKNGGGGKGKRCCPHSLKINLRQLPGFDWILEPAEIDIYMCKGDCHYAQLVGQQQQQQLSTASASASVSSNHALFQGYLHTVDKRRVPKLCCTASKLSSIQIVHYDQDDPSKLTTTRWEGAIVKECACA